MQTIGYRAYDMTQEIKNLIETLKGESYEEIR